MMGKLDKIVWIAILLLLVSLTADAQKLTSLPKAQDTVTGTLPNGISYYIVSDPTVKSHADFALVQKGPVEKMLAREVLASLPNFRENRRPYQFLASHGIGYRDEGFVEYGDEFSVFKFKGVPTTSTAVTDTTLLIMFGISGRYPYEQAIIISGDVKTSEIRERMNVFSMMVTPRDKSPQSKTPAWQTSGERTVSLSRSKQGIPATISVNYASARTPHDVMGTVQPMVTEMFASELGIILRQRIEQSFRLRSIPFADLKWTYRSSANQAGCELYSIDLSTEHGKLEDALIALGRVFADLDISGAGLSEYSLAKEHFRLETADKMDRCISSFLYGSSLASYDDIYSFLRSRNIDTEKELKFFNSFTSALLGPQANLQLKFSTTRTDCSEDTLADCFSKAWLDSDLKPLATAFHCNAADSSKLSGTSMKVKLKASSDDPISGGQLWTFSNGMRVVFRKEGTDKQFSYALMLNSGYCSVPGLRKGEGGYIQDLFGLYNISGMESSNFRSMMEANQVSMKCTVNETDMSLRGTAPSGKLQFVLKSLVSASSERKLDRKAFLQYRKCAKLGTDGRRWTPEGLDELLDSLLCPDYAFGRARTGKLLPDDILERADEFFETCFSNCANGVLVLVGDLDEFELKKQLCRYLGGFHTTRIRSVRPQVSQNFLTGSYTTTAYHESVQAGDGAESVNIDISTALPFSQERDMAFRIALKVIERDMIIEMAELGMTVKASGNYELFPAERMRVMLKCIKAPAAGLPETVIPEDPLVAISVVRNVLANLGGTSIRDDEMKLWRGQLENEVTLERKSREGIVDAVIVRYSQGKDIVSKSSDKAKSVSLDAVRQVLSAISTGGRVEYIVY